MTIIILSFVIIIFIVDGLPLFKKKQWKEFIVIGLLLSTALFLQIGKDLGLPAPVNVIDELIRPLGKTILQLNYK